MSAIGYATVTESVCVGNEYVTGIPFTSDAVPYRTDEVSLAIPSW